MGSLRDTREQKAFVDDIRFGVGTAITVGVICLIITIFVTMYQAMQYDKLSSKLKMAEFERRDLEGKYNKLRRTNIEAIDAHRLIDARLEMAENLLEKRTKLLEKAMRVVKEWKIPVELSDEEESRLLLDVKKPHKFDND